ncbi:MAG: 30S ribosomal protein S1 [Candidatus Zipacnadales bacterium]
MKHDHGEDVRDRKATKPPNHNDDEIIAEFGDMGDEESEARGTAAELDQAVLEQSLRAVRPGEIVKGTVVEVREDEVIVHVGGKYEGSIPTTEFPSPAEIPNEGDEVSVAIIRISEDEGRVILSKKKADYEAVWTRIQESLRSGKTITAMVTERVKGGLRVDLGVSGFVPASQVSTRNVRDLDRFVGRSLRLQVIEADRREKKVILSHRKVVDEERKQRREETLNRLKEGMVCEGKVRNITDYGAFVDLGGVDGLLHISEMAWTRVKHPSEVLKVGDTIEVAVIGIDREKERISLSRRECLPDPWNEAAARLRVGDIVKAKITRLAKNGAFALVENAQVEGFIPVSELSDRRISEPSEVVAVDQSVDLKIISLRPSERRMTLSLAEAEQEKERQEYREYMAGQTPARATLGDQFGDQLTQLQVTMEQEKTESATSLAQNGPGSAAEAKSANKVAIQDKPAIAEATAESEEQGEPQIENSGEDLPPSAQE